MDSLLKNAAQALAGGDPLKALNCVALRNDAAALALRGIAMAQLGDLIRAKTLLRMAERAFGSKQAIARARCIVAEAEIALVSRNLGWPTRRLAGARSTLEEHGDLMNAAHARHLQIRRLLLIGRLDEAEHELVGIDSARLSPALRTAHELVIAGIAIRRLQTEKAHAALVRAKTASGLARIPALSAEVENTARVLNTPAARRLVRGQEQVLILKDVESLLSSKTLVIDACRQVVRSAGTVVSLARRPVLFALARALAEKWPEDISRKELITRAFQAKLINESHRVRLRVEIGRLRKKLEKLARVTATMQGFVLVPHDGREVAVLVLLDGEEHTAVLALLADGESWSSSGLATALGASQRTVQRILDSLTATGKVQWLGRGRARRWIISCVPQFTTILLLTASLAVD